MAEKNRKPDHASEDDKKPPGRPKVLAPELDTRHQLRCAGAELARWKKHSKKIGFPNVSAWLRKVANDAMFEGSVERALKMGPGAERSRR